MQTIIISTRQKGKTRALIEKCHADKGSLIVCPNNAMCEYMFRQAREIGKDIPMPISFRDFVNHKWDARRVERIYIDELLMCIDIAAAVVPVDTVTIDVTHRELINWTEDGEHGQEHDLS